MDQVDVELLVRQIQFTNQAWHTHQACFGARALESRRLREAKDYLQQTLLHLCGDAVEAIRDGETDDGLPTFLLQVRIGAATLSACHVPATLLGRDEAPGRGDKFGAECPSAPAGASARRPRAGSK